MSFNRVRGLRDGPEVQLFTMLACDHAHPNIKVHVFTAKPPIDVGDYLVTKYMLCNECLAKMDAGHNSRSFLTRRFDLHGRQMANIVQLVQ